MICNRNKKHHYNKRSLLKSKFRKKSIFPIRSAQREEVGKKWLHIYVGRRCKLTRMMRLGIFLLLQGRVIIII
jgi:hypothetical protein